MNDTKLTVELTAQQAATVSSALVERCDAFNQSGGFVAADECEELEQIFTDAIRGAGFSFPRTRIERRKAW